VVVKNADLHAKNVTLLHGAQGEMRLAPLHDVMCTRAYPEVSAVVGMFVHGVAGLDDVEPPPPPPGPSPRPQRYPRAAPGALGRRAGTPGAASVGPMPSTRRRSRWRRRWTPRRARVLVPAAVAGVVLALFFGAVSDIGSQSASYLRTVDRGFAALASSVAIRSAHTGAVLQSLLTGGPSLERLAFFATLDAAAAATTRQADDLAGYSSPAPAAAVGACLRALAERAAAAADLRRAFEGVLGGRTGTSPLSPDAAMSVADAGLSAAAQGDLSWAACQRAVHRAPGTPTVAGSRWLTDPTAWSGLWLDSLLPSVTGSPSLAAQPALGIITVRTDPSVLPAGAGPPVVQSTRSLTVHVVVSNTGNVDEPGVQVSARLSGGPLRGPASLSAFVAVGAGQSLSVLLGPFAVVPGSGYTLTVSAATPSGAGTATASLALQVAAVPTTTAPTTTTTTVPRRKGAPGGA
jgi:hypothetical protein